MIIVDDNQIDTAEFQGSITLPTAVILERTANELDRIAEMSSQLEVALITALAETCSKETHVALQSIDLMQQSITALSGFLLSSSQHVELSEIDVTVPVSNIKLKEIRLRLGHPNFEY